MTRFGVSAVAVKCGSRAGNVGALGEIIPNRSFDEVPWHDKRLFRNLNGKRVAADVVIPFDAIAGKLSFFFVSNKKKPPVARRFFRLGHNLLSRPVQFDLHYFTHDRIV
jgi:hypothetical protein